MFIYINNWMDEKESFVISKHKIEDVEVSYDIAIKQDGRKLSIFKDRKGMVKKNYSLLQFVEVFLSRYNIALDI